MTEVLMKKREVAARAAAGISSDFIHDSIIDSMAALRLRGCVLDFGAGTGVLAGRLCDIGLFEDVSAIDLIDYRGNITERVKWQFADLNAVLPFPDNSFDVVCSAEVIEHLENPRFVAREWFRLLRKGGSLVFSTPNNESWRSLISLFVRGHFSAFTGASYPAHISALLRLDIERVLTESGFSEIDFYFTDHGGIPGIPSRTWQSISFGKLTGLRYSDNIICSARKN